MLYFSSYHDIGLYSKKYIFCGGKKMYIYRFILFYFLDSQYSFLKGETGFSE